MTDTGFRRKDPQSTGACVVTVSEIIYCDLYYNLLEPPVKTMGFDRRRRRTLLLFVRGLISFARPVSILLCSEVMSCYAGTYYYLLV